MTQVINEEARQRYVLRSGDATAYAAYEQDGDVITFTHTVVPEALRGQGIGSALIKGALADVRRHHAKVVASCPFVADYIERHAEERDLLA